MDLYHYYDRTIGPFRNLSDLSVEEAGAVLSQVICPDSTILVKASRGMKLEELTAKLIELTREA